MLALVKLQAPILLGLASQQGHLDVVQYLVEEKAVDLDFVIHGK